MAKVEELQARSIEKIFDSVAKAKRYSKEQDKRETRQLVNMTGIDRSIEEWEVE